MDLLHGCTSVYGFMDLLFLFPANDRQEKTFKLTMDTEKVYVVVDYQLKNSGVYLTNVEAEFAKDVH